MSPPVLSLPQDIVESVLLRLPAKSLVRFQLVATSWRSLVSDPIFKKYHFDRAIQNPNLNACRALFLTSTRFMLLEPHKSFSGDGEAPVDLRSPVERDNRRLRIIGCCNGLICFGLEDYRHIFIWNPSTGDYNKLPEPRTPLGESYALGFGYDSLSDDYKVVLDTSYYAYEADSYSMYWKVAIFSLKRSSWRMFENVNGASCNFLRWNKGLFPQSTFMNGAIYWRSGGFSSDGTITAFDVSNESFYTVPKPPVFSPHKNGLGVIGGFLGLVCASDGGDSIVELWVMKEYGVETSWTKLMPLLNPEDKRHLRSDDYYQPLCASGNDTITLIRNAKELIRFNERGEIVEKTRISNGSDKFGGIAFVESIVSTELSSADGGEILDEFSTSDDEILDEISASDDEVLDETGDDDSG